MMFSRFLSAALLLTSFISAQTPSPEQEAALKANVQKFYEAMQEKKYRNAYGLVADDSQEVFMGMAKPVFTEWKLDRIEWDDSLQKAKVVLNVATDLIVAGRRVPVNRPLESTWRLEDGEWIWYHVQPETVRTPFGNVKVNPNTGKPPLDIKEKMAAAPTAKDLFSGLELLTKGPFTFKKNEKGEALLSVKNGLDGHVKVEIRMPRTPGLKVDKLLMDLKAHEEGTFRLVWNPPQDQESIRPSIQATVVSIPIGGSKPFLIQWVD